MATAAPAAVAVVPTTKPVAAPTKKDLRLMALSFLIGEGGRHDHPEVWANKSDSTIVWKDFMVYFFLLTRCVKEIERFFSSTSSSLVCNDGIDFERGWNVVFRFRFDELNEEEKIPNTNVTRKRGSVSQSVGRFVG